MKKFTKRSLAWLASLMLFISLFAGAMVMPVQAATVDYVYSGNYVYNWGQREELATFLSPMAQEFYADNNVAYTTLASLSGASSTSDVPYSDLYDALHKLMYDNLDNPTSYDATRSLFQYTDCQNSGGSISSFYSGKAIGPGWDGGSTWNREHVWPNSKSNGGSNSNTQRETDIMMLRPASVSENSSRSNTAYGESSKFYDPNELGQNVRGDAARIVLYVYVCWGGSDQHDGALNYMWGSSGVMESKDILLKWMEEDPVDTWELGRNDSVEAITGTRNVFVDYPELAFLLFDEDVPAGYDSPSGEGASAGYTVTASTNNANYGTVSVKGSTITATPKTGYAVSGYTILSGNATVTRNGNVFSVTPTSDVSIRINFAKRDVLNVQFVQNGGVQFTQTAYAGDAITLPAHSGSAPAGQTFIGWCAYEVSETTTEPTYYAAGATWYVNTAITLYALYARNEEGGVVNNNTFEPYSGTLTEGDYLIIYQDGALKAEMGSSERLNYAEVSTAAGSIKDPDAALVWRIAKDGSNWTLYNAAAGVYAGGNGTKNKGALLTTLTDFGKWTVSGTSTYEFVNVGNKAKSINANLRRNGTYGYACYSTSTGGALTLYKRASGTMYYFTAAKVVCTEHTYDNACDATCNVCGDTRVPADHAYTSRVTTAATCGKEGVKTFTCSVCGDSYTEAISATGAHTYDNACDADCNVCGATRTPAAHVYVGEVTISATCGADGVKTYTCSVCGVSYTEAIPATGTHTYDNACDADCNACGGTRTPADHVYSANCDTTCNVCGAERSIVAGGETTITFDADKTQRIEFSTTTQVWQHDNLIVTNNKGSATSNVADYSAPVRFYKGSQIIIAYPGMVSLVISAPTGTYGTPWATTLDAAGLTYTEDGGVYTVTFASPMDSITLTASAQIRANAITAVGGAAVEHNYQAVVTDPTCEDGGYTTYTCAACGVSYVDNATDALGHTYDNACDTDCNACGVTRQVGDHVYDGANDTICNECGAVRQIAAQILVGGQTSVSEDCNGLAFFFTANVSGAQMQNGYEYVTDSASVIPFVDGESYSVVRMGAVVSNGVSSVDIEAKYLWETAANEASFAVRLVNIPDNQLDRVITARPYYVYEVDGEEIVVYGDTVSKSYNEAAQ